MAKDLIGVDCEGGASSPRAVRMVANRLEGGVFSSCPSTELNSAKGIAAAVGMFDGVHLGHQMLVKRLCELSVARGLVPGIFTFTDHPMAVVAPERAPELLTTVAERSRLLVEAGARSVVALRFDEELRQLTAEDFMRLLRDRYGVRLLLIGFNHRFGSDRLSDFSAYQSIGSRLGIDIHPAPVQPLCPAGSASTDWGEGRPRPVQPVRQQGSSPSDWEEGRPRPVQSVCQQGCAPTDWGEGRPRPVQSVFQQGCAPTDWEEGRPRPVQQLEVSTPISSSLIRSLLRSGDITAAECQLGHPFTLCGRVIHGRALGRTIDFPTANIKPYIPNQLLPLPGAYAAWLTCRFGTYPSMVNIGNNPTVSSASPLTIEAHLIGYEGDLYDQPVSLSFKQRLRDERRFPDLASLTSQLLLDRQQALSILFQ